MPEKGTDSNGAKHRVFSVTLNSADYPAGGFYRVAFQYWVSSNVNNNKDWREEIFAFGNGDRDTGATAHWTAIDQLAGKKFVQNRQSIKRRRGQSLQSGFALTTPRPMDARGVLLQGYAALLQKCKRRSTCQGVTAVFYKQDENDKTGTVETDQPANRHGGRGQVLRAENPDPRTISRGL